MKHLAGSAIIRHIMIHRRPTPAGSPVAKIIGSSALLSLLCTVSTCLSGVAQSDPAPSVAGPDWLAATGRQLPRWRGFNLLEKFNRDHQQPYHEEDFRLISRLGFNFVRLPLDYRCWISGDWERIDDSALADIDQAIAWGQQYHVHVCLNFHRAPGYTVAEPPEKADLWTDTEAQRVCAKHWALFARRYKGIPSTRLSFNLLNEPGKIDRLTFAGVIQKLVAAIRAEDPDRLIICDGLEWGLRPVPELADLGIAQATRGYEPFELTHFQASWVHSAEFPTPAWPSWAPIAATLKGDQKPQQERALVIDGPFADETALRLRVHVVSSSAELIVETDGKPIFTKQFECGPGDGEWRKSVFSEKFKIYQNIYDRDYSADISAGSKQVRVYVGKGDWLELSEVGLRPHGARDEQSIRAKGAFDEPPASFRFAPTDPAGPFIGAQRHDRQWLHDFAMAPWLAMQQKGVGVIVGEWGAFNHTPHELTLRWAQDALSNWKDAGWGWALWNFRGPFGILDSGRNDVTYEHFEGHQLDRQLLELLQKY
jgi:hypothetical protein